MANEFIKEKFRVVTIKKQSAVGVFNPPTSATDAALVQDAQIDNNLQVLESTETTGTIDRGETEVTHAEPSGSLSFKLRGSGDVTTPPKEGDYLEAGGFSVATKAVLPASGKFTAASGTFNSITIDRGSSPGSQLPSTPIGCALLVGRPVEVDTNPSTLRRTAIQSCTISGTVVTIVFCEDFALTLDATTTIKILPGQLYDLDLAPDDVPVFSTELFNDGGVKRLKDMRTDLEFSIEAAKHCIVKATFKGVLHTWGNAAVPTDMNYGSRPSPAKWRASRARLARQALAATSFTATLGTEVPQHGAPEETLGVDTPQLVDRNVEVKLVTNRVKPGTQDRLAIALANTKMALVVVLDIDGPVGTRWVIIVPNSKIIGDGTANANKVLDDDLKMQAVRVAPLTAIRLFMF